MRTVKAIFEISEESNLAGVQFKVGNKKLDWNELTKKEQIKMLNAWAGHHQLFYRFCKEAEEN